MLPSPVALALVGCFASSAWPASGLRSESACAAPPLAACARMRTSGADDDVGPGVRSPLVLVAKTTATTAAAAAAPPPAVPRAGAPPRAGGPRAPAARGAAAA